MRFHNKYRALGILITLVMLTGCSEEPTTKKPRTKSEHLVEVTQASVREVSIEKTLPGTLQPIRSVKIFTQEEGLLNKLPYFEGDKVEKNTQIAHLDDAPIRADLAKANAELEQAKLDFKRVKNLLPRKLASDDEVAKAKTAVQVAQSEVTQNQIRLNYTKITAPFSGIISERLVEAGDVIPKLDHILTLIDTSSLKAKVFVSELLLPLIKQNDPVTMTIDALGDQRFDAHVMRIHPVIDDDTRRGVIEIELSPVPESALPGQLCRITLSTLNKQRLMIPFDAMRNDNEGSFVYKIVEGKAVKTYIRTGLQSGFDIEVLDGLKDNDTVITKGFFGLKNKKAVKIVNSQAPETAITEKQL